MKHNYPLPTASPFVDFKQYIPLILAAINYELDTPYAWLESDRAAALDYVQELIRWFIEWDDTDVPISTAREDFTHWHVNAQNAAGNAVALTINTSQIFNHYAFQSPSSSSDQFESMSFWLKSGHSYVATAYAVRGGTGGIVTLEVRDADTDALVATVTQDLYNATAQFNFKFEVGFTLTTDRHLKLKGKTPTKNASSSAFVAALTCVMVRH